MSLQAAVDLLVTHRRYTKPKIAKKLNISTLQVHYYHIGKTKTPSAKVCKAFLVEFGILLDIYKDIDDLMNHYNIEQGN